MTADDEEDMEKFCRYKSDRIAVDKDGNTMIIAGLECAPVKGVKASIDFRNTSYQDSKIAQQRYLFVNTEFKF